MGLFHSLRSVVFCTQLRLKSVYISNFEQPTLSRCLKLESPNLPVCTVPLFCTTMTSISPERRWPRSSLQPTSMLKLSGQVSPRTQHWRSDLQRRICPSSRWCCSSCCWRRCCCSSCGGGEEGREERRI